MAVNIPVRWSDNTPELVRHLKQGTSEIQTVTTVTQASIDKLAQAMGGEKLIAAANRMVAAIGQIGGAEKLTNNERERTNALLDKALQKYAALGKDAPAAMKQLEAETRKLADTTAKAAVPATENWSSALGKASGFLGAFGVSLSVGALVGFTKTIMSDADALVRMSDKTEVSIEWLQKFQIVTDDTGDSLESLAGAVNKLQKNIGSNDPAAIEAIRQLGLNYEHIKTLQPEEQFIAIAAALKDVKDQNTQVAIGTAIMGRGFTEILPTIKAGFDDVKDAAVGMSAETARAWDKLGDDAAAFWRRLKGQAATALVDIATFKHLKEINENSLPTSTQVQHQLEKMGTGVAVPGSVLPPALAVPTLPAGVLRDGEAINEMFGDQAERIGKAAAELEVYRRRAEALAERLREELEAAIERITSHLYARAIPAFDNLLLTWEQMRNTGRGLTYDGLIPMAKGFDDAARGALALKLYLDQLTKSDEALQHQLAQTIGLMPDLSEVAKSHFAQAAESANSFAEAFESALEDLPNVMQRAFEGGGGLAGAAKSLGTKLADDIIKSFDIELTSKQKKAIGFGTAGAAALGGAVGGGGGALTGGLAASVAGPALQAAIPASTIGGALALGAATAGIGAAAVGVYMLAKHFLAVSQAEKDARLEFAKLQDLYGSLPATIAEVGAAYERMGHTGSEAEAALKRALDASHESAEAERPALVPITALLEADARQTENVSKAVAQLTSVGQQFGGSVPEAFRDAIRQLASMKAVTDDEKAALLALTKDVKPNFNELIQRAGAFGISLEGLGKPFQRANIEGRAKEIADLFKDLTDQGGDVGGILSGIADEISKLVADSLKFGTAIPENMRPLIKELERAGKLTDEAGNKLEGLAGLSFEDTPLDDSIQSLADAIRELKDAFAGMGSQVQATANQAGGFVRPDIASQFEYGDVSAPGFAGGTHGLRDFGMGQMVTLHGREAVVPESEYQTWTSGGGSPGHGGTVEEHYHFSPQISAIDGADVQSVMEQKLFPAWVNQLRRGRSRTEARSVLGVGGA